MSQFLGAFAHPAFPITLPSEPTVVIEQRWGFAEFIGSRAMLESEGLLPPEGEWPTAYAEIRWQSGRFNFFLSRQRPSGAKGPRKAFAEVDWFRVRWGLTHRPPKEQVDIERKLRELAEITYFHSAKGHAEFSDRFNRYLASTQDKHFQAFKARLGIAGKKRGRPTKQESHDHSHGQPRDC